MIFTRLAYERYRQFHMLDQPTATDHDARVILDAHGAQAVKLPARTNQGDEVWTIHALGVELVVKRDGAFEEPVCATVLPPARFRGLTPLLAEMAEESAKRAAERVAEAERQLAVAKERTAERRALAEQLARGKQVKDKPGTSAAVQAAAHAAVAAQKQAAAQAQRDHEERLQRAKSEASAARNEHGLMLEALRAMRSQLAYDQRVGRYKAALRIAVRHLRDLGATEVLVSIAAVDPDLVSEEFVYGRAGAPTVTAVSTMGALPADHDAEIRQHCAADHDAEIRQRLAADREAEIRLVADHEAEIRQRLAAAMPANVREVCRVLAAAGHQAVTVGGAVRDTILGRTPGDWDVATSAVPDTVMALFRHTVPTGIAHGTVTVVTGRDAASHVEVTTFRSEGAYSDARRPDRVTFGVALTDDLARRDLRVNAIAYDPQSDALIDPYGGLTDIAERRLRAVGPTGKGYDDAVARFTEDGLRVMRAVRFAAALEFELDPDTERGIVPALPSLAQVSKERICDELRKILAAREPSRALSIAVRTGLVELILPEHAPGIAAWAAARGVDRGAQIARWRGRVDAAAPVARLPALLVELADPDLGMSRLDRRSLRTVVAVLRRLKFSNDESAAAATAVGAAAAVLVTGWTEPQIRRLLADAGRRHADTVLALWRAELAVAAGAATELAGLVASAEAILVRGDALSVGELAVTGEDLMTALEMAPGPQVGVLLAELLDRVLVDPSLNSRDRLIAIARGDAAAINPLTSGSNGVLVHDDRP